VGEKPFVLVGPGKFELAFVSSQYLATMRGHATVGTYQASHGSDASGPGLAGWDRNAPKHPRRSVSGVLSGV